MSYYQEGYKLDLLDLEKSAHVDLVYALKRHNFTHEHIEYILSVWVDR
jgi:hypothetical protein